MRHRICGSAMYKNLLASAVLGGVGLYGKRLTPKFCNRIEENKIDEIYLS